MSLAQTTSLGAQWPGWVDPVARAWRKSYEFTNYAYRYGVPGIAPGYWDYLDVIGKVPPQSISPMTPETPMAMTVAERQAAAQPKATVTVSTPSKLEVAISKGGAIAVVGLLGYIGYKMLKG